MIVKAPAQISYGITIIGGVVFSVGLLGWCGVSHRNSCILKLYVFMMSLLCLTQATLCVLLLACQDEVIGRIPSSDEKDYNNIKEWIKSHINYFIIIEAALAGAELFLVTFACCYAGDIRSRRSVEDSLNEALVQSEWWQKTPTKERTAKQKKRDAMRVKYDLDSR